MLKKLYSVIKFISNHPLTCNNRIRALMKFFRWQLGSRLLNKRVIVPWVEDARFITGVGEAGLTGNLYSGFMEYEDMLFLLHALQPEDTFVDIGANIGAYTILASKVVKSKTISYEPLPSTVIRLKDQIAINGIDYLVSVNNMGVGDKKGVLYFTNNNDTINRVCIDGERENTTKVNVVALDEELSRGERFFFKIDVEGFEYEVIEGGKNTLASPNTCALIIELNGSGEEYGHNNEEIHQKILSLNFLPVSYEPFGRTITRLEGYNRSGGNTIYIKDFNLMESRCKSSPKRLVHTANNIFI